MTERDSSVAYRRYLRRRENEQGSGFELVDARAEAKRAPEQAGLMTNCLCTCLCVATARDAGDEPLG